MRGVLLGPPQETSARSRRVADRVGVTAELGRDERVGFAEEGPEGVDGSALVCRACDGSALVSRRPRASPCDALGATAAGATPSRSAGYEARAIGHSRGALPFAIF